MGYFLQFTSLFTSTENDFETFINLRNKDSYGVFINVALDEKVLDNIIRDLIFSNSKINQPSFSLQNYIKLTARILKMMVIFQKPKCF